MSDRKPFGTCLRIYKAATRLDGFQGSNQGHVITSLLLFCLHKGLIEQALVTRMSEEMPWKAEAVLTSDEEVIKDARGSKYVFVGQRHLYSKLTEKTAVVGLPCQAERIADSPALKIGLFCGMTQSERKIEYILHQFNVSKEDVMSVIYRDAKKKRMVIQLRDGRSVSLPWARIGCFFTLPMCNHCLDFSAHYADIAVGDFDFQGTNAVIVRSQRGLEIFEQAIAAGYLWAKEVAIKDLLRHRTSPMVIKEYGSGYRQSPFLRHSKKTIFVVPFHVLNFVGGLYIFYYKYVISYLVLLKYGLKQLWRRLRGTDWARRGRLVSSDRVVVVREDATKGSG